MISFAVRFEFGILDNIPSMALAHSNEDLSFMGATLKILEYLSQNIRKNLDLDSFDTPKGSGLGTVSTCISSRNFLGVEVLVLTRALWGIDVILHDVQKESTEGVILTSSHKDCELIVAITPSDLWNLECRMSDDIFLVRLSLLLILLVFDSLFCVFSSVTRITLDCREVIGILIFGPALVINSMKSNLKFTEQLPWLKNEFTENNLLSNSGMINALFNLNVCLVPTLSLMGIIISPSLLHMILDPSAKYTTFFVLVMLVQSALNGVICADAPLSIVHPFCKSDTW